MSNLASVVNSNTVNAHTISPLSSDLQVSDAWHKALQACLLEREKIHAYLETNLDEQLNFTKLLILITNRRLIGFSWPTLAFFEYPLSTGLSLRQQDHAGVGSIELFAAGTRKAFWRYTMSHDSDATRFVRQFELVLAGFLSGQPIVDAPPVFCPQCLSPLAPNQEECAYCDVELEAPPSSWVLLRLWRFAKPYQWQLLSGFLLMLASTAATLVPPYLTMPLMDNVLIPYQNGQPIDMHMVTLLLGGLLGSALLAWGLGWAKTYILALVSERIGTDLRTITYDHLLHLSLEYFGGKRTGDLMSRIGSESDRICLFLSLHLLDFATDVLMIAMTAAILFSINPWLALVTLIPLPLIVWMIHLVRNKLSTGFEKVDRVWSQVSNVLADTIPGIRVVKAFAQEKRESARFHQANQQNLAVNDRINRIWSLFSPSVTLLTEIGLLVVWAFGIWLVSHDAISVGVLTAFLAYISRFYTRLDSMSRIVSVNKRLPPAPNAYSTSLTVSPLYPSLPGRNTWITSPGASISMKPDSATATARLSRG